MIVSASRRTDIPAFYAPWFMERVRQGFCLTANPFNPHQIRRVELDPQAVDAVVFWTRNPKPLLPHLDELDERGFNYYFLFTINDYPRLLEPHLPPPADVVESFCELGRRLGRERMVWRYDPIILSNMTDGAYHAEKVHRIAESVGEWCGRMVISTVHLYRKVERRLARLKDAGFTYLDAENHQEELDKVFSAVQEVSTDYRFPAFSCAQRMDLSKYGITPGACIDNESINQAFGLNLPYKKDRSQRAECRCMPSIDIGAYDTCPYGCIYCYAVNSVEVARENYRLHNPRAEGLLPQRTLTG